MCLAHFFEQAHPLNLIILEVYAKRWSKYALILNRNWCSPKSDQWFFFIRAPFHLFIGRILSEKKIRGMGLISEKTEAFYAELEGRVEAAISSYSATSDFLQNIY